MDGKPEYIPNRPYGDDAIYHEVNSGIYEKHYTIKEGDYIVDVGAQAGFFSYLAAKKVGPTGRVYAFEPVPDNFEVLVRNTINLPVTTFNVALWDKYSTLDMYYHKNSFGHSVYYTHPDGNSCIRVPALPLDDFSIEKINFMKIDCEGSEVEVLRGAVRLLKAWRPALVIEVHDEDKRRGVLEVLKPFGYKLTFSTPGGQGIGYASVT